MLHVYRCGKCQRFLKYISAKPQRMYCANCDETYSLPQGGTIKLYKVHRGKKEERSGRKMFQVAFLLCTCATSTLVMFTLRLLHRSSSVLLMNSNSCCSLRLTA